MTKLNRGGKVVAVTEHTTPRFQVVEFFGTGDPYFGGAADDRPLTIRGQFDKYLHRSEVAYFTSVEAATEAAFAANHRKGGSVSVMPVWGEA